MLCKSESSDGYFLPIEVPAETAGDITRAARAAEDDEMLSDCGVVGAWEGDEDSEPLGPFYKAIVLGE